MAALCAASSSDVIQLCCEHKECYVAVFDHKEALCYLKGPGATHTYDYVSEEGFSSFKMFLRQGVFIKMEYDLLNTLPEVTTILFAGAHSLQPSVEVSTS